VVVAGVICMGHYIAIVSRLVKAIHGILAVEDTTR